MITIQCNFISVLILRAGQLGALIKYTSRLEGKYNRAFLVLSGKPIKRHLVTNKTHFISQTSLDLLQDRSPSLWVICKAICMSS